MKTKQEHPAIELHKKYQGKIEMKACFPVSDKNILSLVYTPGVAEVSKAVQIDHSRSFELTSRGRTIAVISDGSAVLGLGNIGPEASFPVMEGKAMLLKEFGGVDAVPLVLSTQNPTEIIQAVKMLAPTFAGILLEDISAPRCFQIEESLQNIGIPVFHDDQHGTAIVVSAALRNASQVVQKRFEDLRVVVVGAGAAGLAVSRMLLGLHCEESFCERVTGARSVFDVIVVDKKGALYAGREGQNIYKQAIAGVSNKEKKKGLLHEVIKGADVIIGLSRPGLITQEMIKSMSKKSIVFAMANPTPEIMPEEAKEAGAYVVATGRSDLPNQINNLLAFPGIFRAVIQGRLPSISIRMQEKASEVLAELVEHPSREHIIPDPFFPHLSQKVAEGILNLNPTG